MKKTQFKATKWPETQIEDKELPSGNIQNLHLLR